MACPGINEQTGLERWTGQFSIHHFLHHHNQIAFTPNVEFSLTGLFDFPDWLLTFSHAPKTTAGHTCVATLDVVFFLAPVTCELSFFKQFQHRIWIIWSFVQDGFSSKITSENKYVQIVKVEFSICTCEKVCKSAYEGIQHRSIYQDFIFFIWIPIHKINCAFQHQIISNMDP